jgi:pimeloyl-ACP methyl ester carboxylesterase
MEWNSDFVKYDDNKIHYYYKNKENKKTIALLHGIMDNGLCFSPVATKLSEDYHVIMPDARFHGKTEVSDEKFSYDILEKDTNTLIKNLNIENLQLIGHSMGGAMSAIIAAKYPELVSKIILEDPAIILKKGSKIQKWFVKFIVRIIFTILTKGSYEKILKKGRKQGPTWTEEELKPWAESKIQFRDNNPKVALGIFDDPTDWNEIIPQIKCPILLITSSKGLISDKTAKRIISLNKNCIWIKIDGAGHNIRREQYIRYMEVIQDFLKP